ncbi:MAG: alpha/beta hydrolase [Chromatiales bacterium]|jgi:fermentation-respiration switch protein FrsA (DUF1100 family)
MGTAAKTLLGVLGPALLVGLGLYLALIGMLYFRQASMLYLPELPGRFPVADPLAIGLPFEGVTLRTSDGERLDGWLVPAEPRRATLLFMHGNAGNISHRLQSLKIFNELGLEVLIFDYRGYGRSTGEPTEEGTYRDAKAARDYLVRERGRSPHEVVLFGRSLGAAVAVHQAAGEPCGALIVESGFTSVPDLAAHHYPFLPVRLLSRFDYRSLARIGEVACPVLVIHARDDEIVPFTHAERLYAAAREPKAFLALEGGHNGAFLAQRERYARELGGFLERALGEPGDGGR